MECQLYRVKRSSKSTIGVFMINHIHQCYTLELPWKDNKRNVSCIPAGRYLMQYVPEGASKKYKYAHIRILNVVDRAGILIHVLNYPSQTRGCIGVGTHFGVDSVSYSHNALNELLMQIESSLKAGNCYLTIKDVE